MFEQLLNYLQKIDLGLKQTNHPDGRINSAVLEEHVLAALKQWAPKNLELIFPKTRHWYDFAVIDGTKFYPVNIKIVKTLGQKENLNCKLGLYYALTGENPDALGLSNEMSWTQFLAALKDRMRENTADYYFLVLAKTGKQIEIVSLKNLAKYITNGNNLPFQSNLIAGPKRTYTEFKTAALSALRASLEQRGLAAQYFAANFHEDEKC